MTVKLAISASRALGALQARMTQGARVGAPAMNLAQQAAGSATTPAALRRMALSAGDDVRAAKQMQAFSSHPIPAARRAAAETVQTLEQSHPSRMYDLSRPMTDVMETPWSSLEKQQRLFGTSSALHDPRGVIPARTAPVSGTAPTAPAPSPQFPMTQTPRPNGDTIPGRRRPAIPAAQPLEAATQVARRPKVASSAGDRDAHGTFTIPAAIASGTGYEGRTQKLERDPRAQVSAAFDQQQKQLETATPPEPKYAAYKLHGRMTFRGLPISIENRAGSHRHWHDPHTGREGKTLMRYPYGYIRRTKGLDGDHVDVFIGPNEQAENVYVIMTNKAPAFELPDEEKCMLGFDSEEDAKQAFHEHYDDPKFFRSIKKLSFDEFKSRAEDTFTGTRRKVAAAALWAPYFAKEGYDIDAPIREAVGPAPQHHGGPVEELRDPRGGVEKSLGFPPVGSQRHIIDEPKDRQDRVSAQFSYFDMPQRSTAVEGAWGGPEGEPML